MEASINRSVNQQTTLRYKELIGPYMPLLDPVEKIFFAPVGMGNPRLYVSPGPWRRSRFAAKHTSVKRQSPSHPAPCTRQGRGSLGPICFLQSGCKRGVRPIGSATHKETKHTFYRPTFQSTPCRLPFKLGPANNRRNHVLANSDPQFTTRAELQHA